MKWKTYAKMKLNLFLFGETEEVHCFFFIIVRLFCDVPFSILLYFMKLFYDYFNETYSLFLLAPCCCSVAV